MIALLIVVSQFVIVGMAAARRLDPQTPPRRLLGAAYLLGSGICAFILLALSLAGIPWTPVTFTLVFCVVTVALWMPLLRLFPAVAPPLRESRSRISLVFDAGTFLLVFAHGAYTLKVGGREWDFWAIWGLKARVFFEHRGIDWAYLQHPDHAFAHPDYPPLLPLNFVQVALVHGAWIESVVGLLSTLFAAALLLMVRDFFAEAFGRDGLGAAATLAVAPCAFSYAGMADAPMIAYGTAGLLLIRRGSFEAGAVFLGLAAFTKNEGLALIIAAAIALLLTPRRSAVARLWPAVAIAAPWSILRTTHALANDLASPGISLMRAFARVPEVVRALADQPPTMPLFWIAVAVALIVHARRLDQERLLLVAVLLQLASYFAAYTVTPHQLSPHVATSWPRILQHVAIPLAFVALKLVADGISSRARA